MADFLLETIWFIPFYGLLGAILTLPWSLGIIRKTGPRPAAYFNLLMTLLALVHGTIALRTIWGKEAIPILFHWLKVTDLDLSLTLEISSLSLGALEVVTLISFLTQIYALGYLEKDWSLARFYGLMGFFEAALGAIAISDSLLLSYGLLEMLTLSTYLLVGFWYAQPLVVKAARDAFLTKRVGDIILLMGLVALSSYGDSLDFSGLGDWAATSSLPTFTATLLGLALIAGPIGKCAQFPLNLWLDEAMEGPNPAGIMRNSIVVAAGAYVLIKLQPVLSLSPITSDVLIITGAVTAIGSSLMAIAQIDIKRTLSHSTSAYLGLVFIAVGLGQVDVAFLLLFAHSLAKALLFMSIGSIILTTSNQNITEMGGLWSKMPATTSAFLVGSLGLIGLFPLSMFWTLDRWFNEENLPFSILLILLFVNALSALNLTRVFRLVFLGKTQPKTRRAPEAEWLMALPMVILTVIVLLSPVVPIQWPFFLSFPVAFEPVFSLSYHWALILLMASGLLGCIIGFSLELRKAWARPTLVYLRFFQDLFAYDFYIDRIYQNTVVSLVSLLSNLTAWFDRYVIDGVVNLVGFATLLGGNSLKYNVSGQSQFYIFTILIGLVVLFWLVFSGQFNLIFDYWFNLTVQT